MNQLTSNKINCDATHPLDCTTVSSNSVSWTVVEIEMLLDLPFNDLIYRAQMVHRQHHDPNAIQLSTLISVKTGGCPEDCGYCPQAARYHTGIQNLDMLSLEEVVMTAKIAKERGASRFCMGAAWRGPKQRDIDKMTEIISAVKALGLQTCATLGMLKSGQAEQLREAGLDYYNHNLDTASEFYDEIIKTHGYQDRLDTLQKVRGAGMNVCSGGIVGMGETRQARAGLIAQLANLGPYPESVPINNLVQIVGTPLHGAETLDPLEFVRTIATARISMPKAMVRLSAGRQEMSEVLQALCFLAGANSIFYGDTLLTTDNPGVEQDKLLFRKLGLHALQLGSENVL
ncbi:biotin synthase [Nitrosomonadaceae bacterium]|nr:biotin synthase BioB [Nitrosospira sp.]MDW7642492.1 biotin synthase BioB [Nitrosomonadaceae bacterium]MDW7653690.1 biotin synthase BioB [Nitrosomonadaceae bacterium]MDW7665769.1 biotin synthase BioB [Nitrosomonadaceae bacterium]GDX61308.1 biotin synthase [Nitrosomonadaceae bacterium]